MSRIIALIFTTIGAFGTIALVIVFTVNMFQSTQSSTAYERIGGFMSILFLGGLFVFLVLILITGISGLKKSS